MKNKSLNFMQLETVANALGDLLAHVTFVGGITTLLLVDEAAHHGVRYTEDVDVIIDVATLVEYHKFAEKLRRRGFCEDMNGPVCRWLYDSDTGKGKLDVMPIDEGVLGFSNYWYKEAIVHAKEMILPSGKAIRVVTPGYFLATKFEAFAGRGKGDFFSHDIEDIVFVMENRGRLVIELSSCSTGLKHYFSKKADELLCDDFLNVLPGLLNNPDSAKAIQDSLKIMKSWG